MFSQSMKILKEGTLRTFQHYVFCNLRKLEELFGVSSAADLSGVSSMAPLRSCSATELRFSDAAEPFPGVRLLTCGWRSAPNRTENGSKFEPSGECHKIPQFFINCAVNF